MSLQMQLIFGALVAEMFAMSILVLPWPPSFQNKVVKLFYYGLFNPNVKVSILCVGAVNALIFFDCLQKVINKKYDLTPMRDAYGNVIPGGNVWEVRAQKFYNERNMYITGAILFLGSAIGFNILLLKSMVKNKKTLLDLNKGGEKTAQVVSEVKIDELKGELKKKDAELLALTKQVGGLHDEYQRKADEVSGNNDTKPVQAGLKKDD